VANSRICCSWALEAALGHDIHGNQSGLVDRASNSGEKPDDDNIHAIHVGLNVRCQPMG
jgi:hypothetical protein